MASSRLAPLRRYTRGYTGLKSSAIRSTAPSIPEIQEAIEVAKKLSETELTSLSVTNFNQFVRGRLYVLIDFVMTNYQPPKDTPKTEIDLVLNLCNATSNLACTWLRLFPKLIVSVCHTHYVFSMPKRWLSPGCISSRSPTRSRPPLPNSRIC